MHPLISFVIALLCAWAFRRKNSGDDLALYRYLAAVGVALLPYTDIFLKLFGIGPYLQLHHGLTWSVFIAPVWALAVSFGVSEFARRRHQKRVAWQHLFPSTLGTFAVVWFLSVLTMEGVQPFSPLWDGRLAFGVLYRFDFIVLGLTTLSLVLGLLFRGWQRDIARLGLFSILIYILAATTFHWKAHSFGSNYAKALNLADSEIYALPQPLSPFNWRLIVVEATGRVHDTFVNINRDEALTVAEGATRAYRIQALYKPPHKAVWRIYRRYGRRGMDQEQQAVVRQAWHALAASPFRWQSRYGVFVRFTDPPNNACIMFRDLRSEGARKDERGIFLICKEPDTGEYAFFREDDESFKRLKSLL